jgi:hypothetical protein
MLRILSRLVPEKQPSQILKQLMLLTDALSGSQVFDRFRDLSSFLQGKYTYSVKSTCKQYKIHTYRNLKNSTTFFLESSQEDPSKWYMTGFGADIKKGDFLVIEDYSSSVAYSVESIDYYVTPSDLWMASLIEYGDLPKRN